MVGTGHVSKGCILGLDGSVWATSPGFAVSCLSTVGSFSCASLAVLVGFNFCIAFLQKKTERLPLSN